MSVVVRSCKDKLRTAVVSRISIKLHHEDVVPFTQIRKELKNMHGTSGLSPSLDQMINVFFFMHIEPHVHVYDFYVYIYNNYI